MGKLALREVGDNEGIAGNSMARYSILRGAGLSTPGGRMSRNSGAHGNPEKVMK
jgi:hypothetical protein